MFKENLVLKKNKKKKRKQSSYQAYNLSWDIDWSMKIKHYIYTIYIIAKHLRKKANQN